MDLVEACFHGRLIKASSNRNCQPLDLAHPLLPRKQFINGRPATDLIEAGPNGQFMKAGPDGGHRKAPMANL